MIKYIIHPEYVISARDSQKHFINGQKLIRLYGLNPSECYIASYDSYIVLVPDHGDVIHLYPRSDGNYQTRKD